jgi:hypothetical protein
MPTVSRSYIELGVDFVDRNRALFRVADSVSEFSWFAYVHFELFVRSSGHSDDKRKSFYVNANEVQANVICNSILGRLLGDGGGLCAGTGAIIAGSLGSATSCNPYS